jgi:MoaA/NifB/PqqE/SkfB family radical SAM enzyme
LNSLDLINHVCVSVTWDCNLKCKFCSIWKKRTHEFLDVDEFVAQFCESGIHYPTFAIFGGEPTLHPRLVYLYERLQATFPNTVKSIVTNGYGKAAKVLKEMSAVSRDIVTCISIDGKREKHDAHRGVAGSYDDAINSMNVCFDNFTRPARISYTITPDNICDIEHAVKLTQHYGSDISFRAATDNSYFNGEIKIKWYKWDINKLERELDKIMPTLMCHPRFVYSIPEYLRTGEHLDCIAPFKTAVIDPNLDTRICHSRDPICKLKDVKDYWYKDKRHTECINGSCFRNDCFIDGPYSVTYV